MVLRIPSHHLDALIPVASSPGPGFSPGHRQQPSPPHGQGHSPPHGQGQSQAEREQSPSTWRGNLVVQGLQPINQTSGRIAALAAETDGDKMVDWPTEFQCVILPNASSREGSGNTSPTNTSPRSGGSPVEIDTLTVFRSFLNSSTGLSMALPRCTFLPMPLRDATAKTSNDVSFRQLAEVLASRSTVALAYWGAGNTSFTGPGIVLFPAVNSTVMLMGVIFAHAALPSFLAAHFPPHPYQHHAVHHSGAQQVYAHGVPPPTNRPYPPIPLTIPYPTGGAAVSPSTSISPRHGHPHPHAYNQPHPHAYTHHPQVHPHGHPQVPVHYAQGHEVVGSPVEQPISLQARNPYRYTGSGNGTGGHNPGAGGEGY